MSDFENIRPYRDHEVRPVIRKFLQDPDLAQTVCKYKFPTLSKVMGPVLRFLVKRALKKELRTVNTVVDVQQHIADYLSTTIKKTTDGFTVSGIENLSPDQAYLFISNHRDIAMDPAFLNYALHKADMDTVEIAIGDNLISNPFVSDLMRLNKSFIVRRSVQGIKEKLKAMVELSTYIHHVLNEGTSVWIAQREGRAKDGIDKTDAALIKMLHIAGKKQGLSLSGSINQLNIVPVSISYEYDPCDELKANELRAKAQGGEYIKAEGEDIESIVKGISGYKGKVHVSIGKPLSGQFETADQVANAIDQQVVMNYKLQIPNMMAFEQLKTKGFNLMPIPDDVLKRTLKLTEKRKQRWCAKNPGVYERRVALFTARIANMPLASQDAILKMYANPLINQYLITEDSESKAE
jgi:1-acyl-sn-glycerol-3-phosphate acyltransferase